jgi:lipid A 3-O-deacylase
MPRTYLPVLALWLALAAALPAAEGPATCDVPLTKSKGGGSKEVLAPALAGGLASCEMETESCDRPISGKDDVDLFDFPKSVDTYTGFLATIENDLWGGTDDNYTSGLRALYSLPAPRPWLGAELLTVSLTQLIYNPSDIYREVPDPNDRPYSGYLHLGLALHSIDEGLRRRDSFGLDLGVVGPSSLAEDAQNAYHDFRDVQRPTGWENQLKDEPIVQLSYEVQLRPGYVATPRRDGFGWDHLVIAAATAGNAHVYAEAGTELRAGWNLAPRWAVALVAPGPAASSPIPWAQGTRWVHPVLSVEAFAGARARLVARDIALDGNTFRDSPSVDKNIAVADVYAGFGWSYGWFSMTATETYRTEEYEGQDSGQFFGSLTLGISF